MVNQFRRFNIPVTLSVVLSFSGVYCGNLTHSLPQKREPAKPVAKRTSSSDLSKYPVSLNGMIDKDWPKGSKSKAHIHFSESHWHDSFWFVDSVQRKQVPIPKFTDRRLSNLCAAIRANDLQAMKNIIDSGVDLDESSNDGITVLFFAYHLDQDFRPFELLIRKGANPNATIPHLSKVGSRYPSPLKSQTGNTISHLVAKSNYNRLFKFVFSNGGNPNLTWHNADFDVELTPLTLLRTSAIDAVERLELLLDKGGDPKQLSPACRDLASSKVADGIRRSLNCFDRGCSMALLLCKSGSNFELEAAILKNVLHPHPYEGASFRLMHWLAFGESKFGDEAFELESFQSLVGWLESRGESYDNAKADLAKWRE
jgi:hypothetical protein